MKKVSNTRETTAQPAFPWTGYSHALAGKSPPPPARRIVFSGLLIAPGGDLSPYIGALAVADGMITDTGPTEDVLARNRDKDHVPADGYMAIPGLINAHTHVPMSFFRGLGHEKKDMIETFLFPAERSLTPEILEPLSYSYIYGGLRAGVTCFGDHYYFSEGVGKALDTFGVRGVVGETAADLGSAFPDIKTWKRALDLINRWPFSSRITPAIAPHAADTVSEGLLKEMSSFARANNLPLHMHLSQTRGERQRVLSRYGVSPVKAAARAGALGERTLAVHLISIDDEDAKILGDSGTTAGFCPTSQIIYEHLAPVEKFIQHEIPIALGTDCAASHDSADIMGELKLTAILLKESEINVSNRTPAEVLKMATTSAATVFGLSKICGTLEVGKAADLVFLKRDLSTEPMSLPATNLIYSLGSQHIDHVMVDGKWVLWKKELVTASEADLMDSYQRAVSEIRRRIGM